MIKKDRIIHTALERPVWKRLATIAIEKEISVSSLVRQAIDNYLKELEHESKNQTAKSEN